VGRPGGPFFEVAIFDDNGKRLGPGQVGEIAVRSAMSIGEYWGLPEKTREAFFPGDWFRPFDVGYLDEDGFLYYADRAGDKITAAGGVVFPHLVETAVLRHEAVANCGVVGLGEPGEQQVVAAVVLKADRTGSTELVEEILAGTADLPGHERPSRVMFVDELPTVLGGAKVQRQALREQLATQP
jgi:acyl-coenzyme A synthetase/AMP-(fatty) acid ligase